MTIDSINVEETVKKVTDLIAQEENLSPALKGSLEVMILLISLLVNRLGLNSRNSSKPPVTDPHRKKETKTSSGRKPGGQHGHIGKTLKHKSPIPISSNLFQLTGVCCRLESTGRSDMRPDRLSMWISAQWSPNTPRRGAGRPAR